MGFSNITIGKLHECDAYTVAETLCNLWTMMADLFPTDPKRIRERIRRYERALKKELEAVFARTIVHVDGRCRRCARFLRLV